MPVEVQNQVARSWWRRRRRWLVTRGLPTVTWLVAIGAAVLLYQHIGLTGSVTGFADDQPVTLAHSEVGVVRDLHVQLYDQVARGQVLLTMDDRQERIQLGAIEKDIERLSAEVLAEQARLTADNARAEAEVDDLVRRFAIDREAAHIEYLTQLMADARDRITLRGLKVEYEIVRSLHEQANAPYRELNDIQTEAESLETAITENQPVLARSKEAFEEADRRWAEYTQHAEVANAYEPALTPLRLAVEVRRRDLEEVVRQIDMHVLRAPIDGQVTTLLAHVGDHVQPGATLATVSPTSTNLVVAYLPEQMALATNVGAPVSVDCAAMSGDGPRRYAGTVVSMSAAVAQLPQRCWPTPTYPTWGRGLVVALSDNARLMPGEAVTVRFLDGQ